MKVTMRAGRCGRHHNAECKSCRAALDWTNAEMDRLRAEIERKNEALWKIERNEDAAYSRELAAAALKEPRS